VPCTKSQRSWLTRARTDSNLPAKDFQLDQPLLYDFCHTPPSLPRRRHRLHLYSVTSQRGRGQFSARDSQPDTTRHSTTYATTGCPYLVQRRRDDPLTMKRRGPVPEASFPRGIPLRPCTATPVLLVDRPFVPRTKTSITGVAGVP